MRNFLLMLSLFFVSAMCYGQGKRCSFPYEKIVVPDRLYSCQLLDTMRSIPLKDYNRKSKIPGFIKRALHCWTEGRFSIANPGQRADIGCGRDLFSFIRPDRQLLYLGRTKNYLLISYKRGSNAVNSPIVLVRFEKRKIISVWFWQWFATNTETKEDLLQSLEFYWRIQERHPDF